MPAPAAGRRGLARRPQPAAGARPRPARPPPRLADPTGGAVALDFVQLVTVDRDIAAGGRFGAARKRPQHGEHRRRRHQGQHEPECHGVNSPAESDIAVAGVMGGSIGRVNATGLQHAPPDATGRPHRRPAG